MKKIMKIAVMIGLLVIGGAGVYAMTRYYLAKSVKSEFTKKHKTKEPWCDIIKMSY